MRCGSWVLLYCDSHCSLPKQVINVNGDPFVCEHDLHRYQRGQGGIVTMDEETLPGVSLSYAEGGGAGRTDFIKFGYIPLYGE